MAKPAKKLFSFFRVLKIKPSINLFHLCRNLPITPRTALHSSLVTLTDCELLARSSLEIGNTRKQLSVTTTDVNDSGGSI